MNYIYIYFLQYLLFLYFLSYKQYILYTNLQFV